MLKRCLELLCGQLERSKTRGSPLNRLLQWAWPGLGRGWEREVDRFKVYVGNRTVLLMDWVWVGEEKDKDDHHVSRLSHE